MDILLAAVLGELITRSTNFFISNSFKPTSPNVEDSLYRILLRAQVIADEAMGRQISNHAALQQLDMLRDAMHRGYYILDTFRCLQSHDHAEKEEANKGQVWSHSLSSVSSRVNSLQGSCSSTRNKQILQKMQRSVDDLTSMIGDLKELVLFLSSYPPRLYRQPYSMHLLMGNCMFGRQTETELVISFLLHTRRRPHGSNKELEVLPIVGPGLVGKSTLVAHVCRDQRVRGHFSEILFFHSHDFTGDELATLMEGYAAEYQNRVSSSNEAAGRLLVVVELAGDLDEGAWNRMCSAVQRVMPGGSKIVVTSRSDKITKLGTAGALRLNYLSPEAYWHFFKTLTFGTRDPKMHPRFARLAMEISSMLSGCFLAANYFACLLRENFDIRFWRTVLAMKKLVVSKLGEHPLQVMNRYRPAHICRMAAASSDEDFVLYDRIQCSSQEEVPAIKIKDVVYGNVKPRGRFDALVWRSQIPPYYGYGNSCEIHQELKAAGVKRKRVARKTW